MGEVWSPAKRYVCAESYPEGAMMAVRAAPTRESKQLMTIGACKEYFVTGRVGDYLQINVEIDGVPTPGYVPHIIGDRVLLVPAPIELQQQQSTAPAAAAAAALSRATEAVTVAAAAEAATTGRVEALEARVVQQEHHIQTLEKEIVQLRTQLALI